MTASHVPTRLGKAARLLGRFSLTLLVVAAALGAGLSGHRLLSTQAAVDDGPPPAPATRVATQPLVIEQRYAIERRFAGQFEARQATALAFEAPGTIIAVGVREGDRVARGDVVARLDTRLLEAERARLVASLAAIAAQVELARRTNDRQEALREAGHVSDARVDDSSLTLAQLEAGQAETRAALDAIDVRLSKAEILAPFDGTVADRLLDEGSIAAGGAPVVTLLEEAPARFRVGIDPRLAARLDVGHRGAIETASGRFDAQLTRQTPELDPATRAQVVYFETDATPPARTTGEIVLEDHVEAAGAWVPVSALRQGPRGTWTILTVDAAPEAPVVAVEAVEILHLADGRAFARGTFTGGALVIPNGTHRVVPGERVALLGAGQDEERVSWAH